MELRPRKPKLRGMVSLRFIFFTFEMNLFYNSGFCFVNNWKATFSGDKWRWWCRFFRLLNRSSVNNQVSHSQYYLLIILYAVLMNEERCLLPFAVAHKEIFVFSCLRFRSHCDNKCLKERIKMLCGKATAYRIRMDCLVNGAQVGVKRNIFLQCLFWHIWWSQTHRSFPIVIIKDKRRVGMKTAFRLPAF